MDPTAYTLLLAMGAAVCAAFISGWLLHMMVPDGLFWVVVFANLASAPVGLFLPWYCSRQQRWLVVPTVNIFSATVLSILVSVSIVLLDRAVIQKVPANDMMSDEFVRTLIAVAGISMATSLVVFLVHYTAVQEANEIRRLARKLKRVLWWEPKPKVVLCDDLEAAAPGDCAICLEELATLPAAMAHEPPPGCKAPNTFGLLRFPCQHTFHAACASRWIAREVNCPMCRQPIGSIGKCARINLRGPAPPDAEGDAEMAAAAGTGCTVAAVKLGVHDEWILTEADSNAGDFPVASTTHSTSNASIIIGSRCLSPGASPGQEEVLPGSPAPELGDGPACLADVTALRIEESDGDGELP